MSDEKIFNDHGSHLTPLLKYTLTLTGFKNAAIICKMDSRNIHSRVIPAIEKAIKEIAKGSHSTSDELQAEANELLTDGKIELPEGYVLAIDMFFENVQSGKPAAEKETFIFHCSKELTAVIKREYRIFMGKVEVVEKNNMFYGICVRVGCDQEVKVAKDLHSYGSTTFKRHVMDMNLLCHKKLDPNDFKQ